MKHKVWEKKLPVTIMTALICVTALAGTNSAQEIIFTGEAAPLTIYQTYMASETGEEPASMTIDVEDLHVLGTVNAGEDTENYVAVLISNIGTGQAEEAEVPETEPFSETETGETEAAEAEAVETEAVETEAAAGEETGEMPWITGFMKEQEVLEKIPALSLEDLPSATGWNDRTQGMSGEDVITVQENLTELGYLDGAIDGQFGPGTAAAVRMFQRENGLPETGTIDVITYYYLSEKAEDEAPLEVPYPPVYTVEDKFADILDDVEDASLLEDFTEPRWRYTYDAFEGEGIIADGTVLGTYEESSRPVDTISMEISSAMKVKRQDTGLISVYPILQVKSVGAYRPYVKSILFKAGNTVCEFGEATLSGKLSGIQVEEVAEIPFSTEELKKLTDKAGETLQIRVKGNSRTYDLEGMGDDWID